MCAVKFGKTRVKNSARAPQNFMKYFFAVAEKYFRVANPCLSKVSSAVFDSKYERIMLPSKLFILRSKKMNGRINKPA